MTKTLFSGLLVTTLLATLISTPLLADTLELSNGTVLDGEFVGKSNGIVMFNTDGKVEAYPEDEVVTVNFGSSTPAAVAQSGSQPDTITVPSGTRLMIRTIETVDTRQHKAGHKFRGQIEGAIVVNGITIAPSGTTVYGVLTSSSQAGNVVGTSNLSMEFTDIMINDVLYPIATTGLATEGGGEGKRTLRRSARAAAVGGLIDGKSGARTGAKVGAGAAILTSGASINVPSGTLLETTLRTPLVLQ